MEREEFFDGSKNNFRADNNEGILMSLGKEFQLNSLDPDSPDSVRLSPDDQRMVEQLIMDVFYPNFNK